MLDSDTIMLLKEICLWFLGFAFMGCMILWFVWLYEKMLSKSETGHEND